MRLPDKHRNREQTRGTKTRCPLCNKPFDRSESSFVPFCSKRCQQIDLGHWLGEQYGLPWESDPVDDTAIELWRSDGPSDDRR